MKSLLGAKPWLGVRDIADPCPPEAFVLARETDNGEVDRQMHHDTWDVHGDGCIQVGCCAPGAPCLWSVGRPPRSLRNTSGAAKERPRGGF